MKKLFSGGMSGEAELKMSSPGVIAKLIGLDGMPPRQSAGKNHKKLFDNYSSKGTVEEKPHRSAKFKDRQSFRRKPRELQKFEDIFVVSETVKMENNSSSALGTSKSSLEEVELSVSQKKLKDAKRLLTDEKVHYPKEFHGALGVLDSNKDLLQKFLQQPDSLYAKHLRDLQDDPSYTRRKGDRHSSDDQRFANQNFKADRGNSWKNYGKITRESRSPTCHCGHDHTSHVSSRPLKTHSVEDELSILPTRIVVLKPTVGKMFPDDVGLSRSKSRESQETAKQTSRQMTSGSGAVSFKLSSSGSQRYVEADGSFLTSENESACTPGLEEVNCRSTLRLNGHYRSSVSCSKESTVSREAKRRLAERWKMARRSQAVGVISKRSTLAEMLAIPDKEILPEQFNRKFGEEGFCDKFSSYNVPPACRAEPLGISSRDGWKGEYIRNLPRSRSLPASLTTSEKCKRRQVSDPLRADWYVMPNEAVKQERKEAAKRSLNKRDGSPRRNSRRNGRQSHSSHCQVRKNNDTSMEISACLNKGKTDAQENNLPGEDFLFFNSSVCSAEEKSSARENVFAPETDNMTSDNKVPQEFPEMLVKEDTGSGDENSRIQEELLDGSSRNNSVHLQPSPGFESPSSSKETDQPSPVSVLEPPFTDDLTSYSECFESLSANLHGLRLQLRLLKSESMSSAGEPQLVSSDDDVSEGSAGYADELLQHGATRNWEFSYLIDVLRASTLNDSDPDVFIATWHSSDCPVDPFVFDALEGKQSDQTLQMRCKRKLLFDRINSIILHVYKQFADPHPWVRPKGTGVGHRWIKDGIQERLWKLLECQEDTARKDATATFEGGDAQWLGWEDELDMVGREIERSLMDELAAEIVQM